MSKPHSNISLISGWLILILGLPSHMYGWVYLDKTSILTGLVMIISGMFLLALGQVINAIRNHTSQTQELLNIFTSQSQQKGDLAPELPRKILKTSDGKFLIAYDKVFQTHEEAERYTISGE